MFKADILKKLTTIIKDVYALDKVMGERRPQQDCEIILELESDWQHTPYNYLAN